MWIVICLIVVALIAYSFYSDTQKVKKRNISLGGLKTLFPEFVESFESMGMELAQDSGTLLLYKKKVSDNPYANKYLYLGIESKFTNIAFGYVINPDGKKINGLNVEFYKNYTDEEVEMTIRKIIGDLDLKGAI